MAEISSINASAQVEFMDPSSLNSVMSNKNISEEEKLKVVAQQFETMFTSQFMKEGLGKDFKQGHNSMAPDIVAHALSQDSPFGISHVLQCELQNQK